MLLRLCILLLISVWMCIGHSSFYQGRPRFGMKIEHQVENTKSALYGFGSSEGYFEQKLDHTSNSSSTWLQHYYWNDQHYNRGSNVIFLMLGGEGPERKSWVENENYPFMKWAKNFGAAVFALEHRFYGKSRPTVNMSIENLQYLNTMQAIEDIALFIKTINAQNKFNSPRWITFGGSYAGALSLWARQQHPELIAGAVGSSAPLQPVLDFWEYLQVVETALQKHDPKCAAKVEQGFKTMYNYMNTKEGRGKLSTIFHLDPPFEKLNLTYNDIQFFYNNIYSNFQLAVQYNGVNLGKNKDKFGIVNVCDLMNQEEDPVQALQEVNKYMAEFDDGKTFTTTANSYKEFIAFLKNETFDDNDGLGQRAWTWQQCTEFGYFQSTDANTIFGAVTPNNLFIDICRDVFGDQYNASFIAEAIQNTLYYYGGADKFKGTNVVIPNGSLDPWHVLGMTNSSDPSVVTYLLTGTAHCADMYPVTENTSEEIIKLHKVIVNNLDMWINGPSNLRDAVEVSNTWLRPQAFDQTSIRMKRSVEQTGTTNEETVQENLTWTRFRKMHFGRPPHGFKPYTGTANLDKSAGFVKGNFSQPYDHFDNKNPKRFQQKYYKNSQFAKKGGPNFLMIGGEGPESEKWVLDTNLTYLKWAQEFGATVYLLEHRYYGDSIVGENDKDQDLKYLNSLQMLYDVADFIKYNNYLTGSTAKWITFGGSYSGSLSLWMRALFPNLVTGAVGSSAPIQAKLDFYEYLQVVEASIRTHSNECANNVGEAFKEMHRLVLTGEGRKNLSDIFTLRPPWTTESEIDEISMEYFFSNIFGQFQGAVQYSGDNSGAYANGYGIPEMCGFMLNTTQKPLENVAKFNEYMGAFYNNSVFTYTENNYSENVEFLKNPKNRDAASSRYWMWQTCNEFGYFQSTDLGNSIFGSPTPLNMYTKMCQDVFGNDYVIKTIANNVKETNWKYGGRENYAGTNVVIPNGSLDPWHALGKLHSSNPSVATFLINGTAHCADMYPARAEDPPDLTRVRNEIKFNLQAWLNNERVTTLTTPSAITTRGGSTETLPETTTKSATISQAVFAFLWIIVFVLKN